MLTNLCFERRRDIGNVCHRLFLIIAIVSIFLISSARANCVSCVATNISVSCPGVSCGGALTCILWHTPMGGGTSCCTTETIYCGANGNCGTCIIARSRICNSNFTDTRSCDVRCNAWNPWGICPTSMNVTNPAIAAGNCAAGTLRPNGCNAGETVINGCNFGTGGSDDHGTFQRECTIGSTTVVCN